MNLQTDDFLTERDIDAILAIVLNLAAEVVELQERVRALEASRSPDAQDLDEGLQDRIDALVARVGRPLHAGDDLL